MNNLKQQIDFRYAAVAISLLISLLMRIFPASLNDDSYLYIRTAEIFLDHGAQAAFSHYSWASFSVLIALLSYTGLSLINSAFLINAFFFALLAYSFTSAVRVIDSNKMTLFFAALCILIFPELNEYRSMIIRDIAFWALVVLSLWQLLLFIKEKTLTNGALFCGALLAASAFRVEALLYLVGVPLILAVISSDDRKLYLILLLANLAVLFSSFVVLLPFGVNLVSLIVDFVSVYLPFIDAALNADPTESDILARAVFGNYAADYSDDLLWLFVATGLFSLLIVKVTSSIGLPILLTLAAGLWKRCLSFGKSEASILVTYIAVNFAIVFGFIYITRFLPGRHSMVLSLVVLLAIPFIVSVFFQQARASKNHVAQAALCLLAVYCTVDSYYSFGHRKDFIPASIQWLDQNSSENQNLITNNHAIAYSSGKVEDYDQVPRNLNADDIRLGKAGDLVAVEINLAMSSLMAELEQAQTIEFVMGFPTNNTPRVAVYQVTGN